MAESTLSFARTTNLVARALGIRPAELHAAFRPATLEDLPRIVALRSRVLGEALRWQDDAYLRWRYSFIEGAGRGAFLIVSTGERLLGMIGTEKLRLTCNGGEIDALSTMDIMVDPDLDGTGLGIWLNMAMFAAHPVVIEIGANPNSLRLISRLFYRLPNRTEYTAPLRFSRFFFNRTNSSALASTLALPADTGARLWRSIGHRAIPKGWFFHDIRRFGPSVRELFSRRWAPEEVTIVRTSDYLNWRLLANPRATYKAFGAYANGDLVGYAAYQSSQRADGLRFVSLVDWLVDAHYGLAGYRALVRETLRRAASEGADFANVATLHQRSERSMLGLGFIGQESQYNTVGIRCAEPGRYPVLMQGDAWFLTEAGTDRDGIG